ncbi:MAG: imidazole glycerol phosphate synthase subunit HisH [Verrucomicrobiales bacterium]|nr:imidazole glycerol phosphate synthase subunit HisH [Verrucomicrobiales bacterium]
MELGILDYGAGNLRSVNNAFEALGRSSRLIATAADFDQVDVLIFPGQGAFGDCVKFLKHRDLWTPLQEWLKAERPYLGICLGYQLLFEGSEECPGVQGLAAAGGVVRRFDPGSGLKIPHMGWNAVQWSAPFSNWWQGLPNPSHLYFVHSYYPDVADSSEVLCTAEYGRDFAAGIARPHLMAVQFHPEKSQTLGLKLLGNALTVLEGAGDPA